MKHSKTLALSMLLSIAVPVCANDVVGTLPAVELPVDGANQVPGLLSQIIAIPGYLVGTLTSALSQGTNGVLGIGSKVIEGTGNGITVVAHKVGDIGSSIVTTAQEHRTITGVAGLIALYTVLTKTEIGRSVAQRIQKALETLLNMDDMQDDAESYRDHRVIAAHLRK